MKRKAQNVSIKRHVMNRLEVGSEKININHPLNREQRREAARRLKKDKSNETHT